jgi:hypothetical protein
MSLISIKKKSFNITDYDKAKNICLQTYIEDRLPKFIQKPSNFPRSLIAFDVGKKSNDLSNYINKLIGARKNYIYTWKKEAKF